MKRFKKIYVLLGVLVLVCAATFAVTRVEEYKEKIKNSDEVILRIEADTVQTLTWENESGTFSFKRDDTWIYEEDENFPVDGEIIQTYLARFEEFGVAFIIEGVEDYSQYGLDEPVSTVELTTDEETYTLEIGDYSQLDEERYVSIGDGNVYLVSSDPLEDFDAVLSDVIDHDEIPIYTQMTSMKVAGEEEYTITYQEESTATYCEEDIYFTEKDEKTVPLDTTNVEDYLYSVSSTSLLDYATYHATEEDLEGYGLDTPELTITVAYISEDEEGEEISDQFVLHVSRDPVEKAAVEAEEDAEEETITAYARVGESQIVYQISGEAYQALLAVNYNDLRHEEIITAAFEDVYQVDITLEGTVYTLTSEVEDEERIYYYQEEEAGISAFQTALEFLEAEEFTEERVGGKKEISLTLYLENENFPEISLKLYRKDGEVCLAVVDGKSVAYVPREQVVELIEAVNGIVL